MLEWMGLHGCQPQMLKNVLRGLAVLAKPVAISAIAPPFAPSRALRDATRIPAPRYARRGASRNPPTVTATPEHLTVAEMVQITPTSTRFAGSVTELPPTGRVTTRENSISEALIKSVAKPIAGLATGAVPAIAGFECEAALVTQRPVTSGMQETPGNRIVPIHPDADCIR